MPRQSSLFNSRTALAGLFIAISISGCSSYPLDANYSLGFNGYMELQSEINFGDRQREWGLIYFHSWRQYLNEQYLKLSHNYFIAAVKHYFEIQKALGHSYPDFYSVDIKRREACQLLYTVRRMGEKYRANLPSGSVEGCLRPVVSLY